MSEIARFAELVAKLQSTTGRLEKEGFLREVRDDPEVLEILKFLFDPYIVSGISSKKVKRIENKKQTTLFDLDEKQPGVQQSFADVLAYFREHNTGRDEDIRYLTAAVEKFGNKDLIFSVIKKDLRIGIQATTLNKVFGEGFVPKFDVMLAEKYSDNKDFLNEREFIITEKLDGVRSVLIFNGETPTFFSRQGQAVENLTELTEQVKHLPKDFVYDGEMLLDNDGKLPSKDLYRATVKVVNSDGAKRGVIFNIFDMPEKAAFMTGQDIQPCIQRKKRLHELLQSLGDKCPKLKEIEMLYVGSDTAKIDEFLQKFAAADGEGVMVNAADGAYECKRSKNLMKVKQFNTADVLVLSAEEGSGANKGKLGAVIVRFIGPDGKEYTCKVGSGFKQEERDFYFQNPHEIVGKIIEIGYFELSQNQNDTRFSLRFPTFKHLRPDKTEISMY